MSDQVLALSGLVVTDARAPIEGACHNESVVRLLRMLTVLVFPAATLGACGLSAVGTGQGTTEKEAEAGASPSSGEAEAGAESGAAADDGGVPLPPTACGQDACGLTVPAGWSLAAVTINTTPCPLGFDTTDVVEKPVAGASACKCTCNVTSSPSCATGTVATKYDYSSGCGSTSSALVASADGKCNVTNLSNGNHELFPSPPPAGTAACLAPATADKTAVQSDALRVCSPPTCGVACQGAGFKTCLLAPGDMACPAGAPEKHLVGTDVKLACTTCGCTATGPTSCEGTWTLYSDTACATLVDTVPPNVCTQTTQTAIRSYKWSPVPISVKCDAGAPAPGVASLVGPTTVCCK